MELKRITIAAAAAILAVSGIGSILVLQGQPVPVQAIDLTDDDPAIRRDELDGPALEAVDDDDAGGDDDDDATDNDDTGDGDSTRGDDGTSGGNNTGDGDDTGDDTNTGAGDTTD